jgi:hypothetical protein
MLLPPEAIQQAYNFKMDAKTYGYDTSFRELSFSKGNRNYSRILTKLSEIALPDPSLFRYNNLTLEELKSLLTEIMIKILGDNHTSEIEYLNSLLYPTRTSEMFDSILEEEIVGHDFIPKRIHINRQLATIQVASTGHEYIHALLSKYKGHNFNKHITNIHYNELSSILTEYVIVYELSQILKDKSLREKHSIIRAKRDKDYAIEHKATDGLSAKLHKAVLDRHTLEALKLYIDYESHNSFGYILSDIYSRRLFTMYQDDPQVLLTILRHIISGEKSIQDLLKYYDLSLTNIPTIETFNTALNQINL